MFHFTCRPLSANPGATSLEFAWDPETGELAGRDAQQVRKMAAWGQVDAHPMPWAWTLGADPLRSYTDMAAIVGSCWQLPAELVEHYPQLEDEGMPEFTYVDADGVMVAGRDMLTY